MPLASDTAALLLVEDPITYAEVRGKVGNQGIMAFNHHHPTGLASTCPSGTKRCCLRKVVAGKSNTLSKNNMPTKPNSKRSLIVFEVQSQRIGNCQLMQSSSVLSTDALFLLFPLVRLPRRNWAGTSGSPLFAHCLFPSWRIPAGFCLQLLQALWTWHRDTAVSCLPGMSFW